MHDRPSPARRDVIRSAAVALLLAGTLAALLALDWRLQGPLWQFLRGQTGEESPAGQVRGLLELGGNLIRVPPQTDPYAAINHTAANPFAINVFLQKEVEEPKLRAMLQMIQAAGFGWLRQEFPWEDLEVDGRGQFTDSRVDRNGDGTPDTVDAWAKYDRLVALAEEYGFQLIVRLSNPPYWAQTDQSATLAANYAPPAELQDFVNFAAAVAQRYQGRISYYQVWNEPNIYPEWGENFADPVAYTDMLCRTAAALRAVDPQIVILSAAIAPTVSLDGKAGYQDVVYLHQMYAAGAGPCFDILAAQGYGLFSGPDDRRLRATSVTATRHIYYRDLMVVHGDAHKPIWLSEAAWNAVLDAPLPRDQIDAFDRFGLATQAQAARYMPRAYQRAAEEFPWIGNIAYWFFTRPDPFEAGQSFYYFRMVEPDYAPEKPTFTPLPVYTAMQDYIQATRANPVLYRGTHQAESWEISTEAATTVADATAQFGQALRLAQLQVTVRGTAVWLRWRPPAAVDWQQTQVPLSDGAASTQRLRVSTSTDDCPAGVQCVVLPAEGPFIVDAVQVVDNTWRSLTPVILAGLALLLTTAGVVLLALRRRWRPA